MYCQRPAGHPGIHGAPLRVDERGDWIDADTVWWYRTAKSVMVRRGNARPHRVAAAERGSAEP
jgi:hypothetical protein